MAGTETVVTPAAPSTPPAVVPPVAPLPTDIEAMLDRRSADERAKVATELAAANAAAATLRAEKDALEARLKLAEAAKPNVPPAPGTVDAAVLKQVADMAVQSAMASVQPQLDRLSKIETELHMSSMTNYANSLIQAAQGRIIPAMVMMAVTPTCTKESLDVASVNARNAYAVAFPAGTTLPGTQTPLPPGAIQPPLQPAPATQPPGVTPAGTPPATPAGLPTPAGQGAPPATVNGLPTADAAAALSQDARRMTRKEYAEKRAGLLKTAGDVYRQEVASANPMMEPRSRR